MFKKVWLYGDNQPSEMGDKLIGYRDGEGRFIDVAYDLFWEKLGYEVANRRFAKFEEAKQYALTHEPQPRTQACNLSQIKVSTDGALTTVSMGRTKTQIEDLGLDEAGRPTCRTNGFTTHGTVEQEIKSCKEAMRMREYRRRRGL